MSDTSVVRDPVEAEWGDEEIMAAIRAQARIVAREEVASLVGLVFRRLNEDPQAPLAQKLAGAFGEALRDFGVTKAEPGTD